MKSSLIIGSRGSRLALTQSNHIADRLRALLPGFDIRIEIITTTGDRILDAPLAKIGGKGLFTKELETALLEKRVDLAVHSLKDLPTEVPEGLAIAAIPVRENPADVFVSARYASLDALPDTATIGTSSLRRSAQLLAYRPSLKVVDLRGNVDTRLRKVAEGELDAAVLACAGITRIGRADAITQVLPAEIMISAPGQGALGIEMRADDAEGRALIAPLIHTDTTIEVTAERTVLAALEGGCQVPIGALARVRGQEMTLSACVCSLDGKRVLKTRVTGSITSPVDLGMQATDDLIAQGAREIMAAIR
ncbi:MAG: hydroxymethylbilane synthase [Candidatus Hydrogenedentes bacterium]|nr:hydroxymethylbilane synthase [Candidatus Hydrogenedentota bacterium]